MSYEGKMLQDLKMPTRKEVEEALLIILFNNNGTIKEFATGEEIVNEIANKFSLTENQRNTKLERIYRKEIGTYKGVIGSSTTLKFPTSLVCVFTDQFLFVVA